MWVIRNYGNYIIISISLIYIISLLYFVIKGYHNFIEKINIIIKNNNNDETYINNHKIAKVKGKIKSKIKTIYFPPKKKFQRKNDKKHKKLTLIDSSSSKINLNSKIQHSKTSFHFERFHKKNLTCKEVNHKNSNIINNSNGSKTKLNNINKNYNDFELNTLNYKEALEIDKRTYFQYYISLLKTKHVFIFTFITRNDYNSFVIKICLFFFGFALYLTVNVLFFTDSTMHKIYEDKGKFNFVYQIPQIIYSTIISSIINFIIRDRKSVV